MATKSLEYKIGADLGALRRELDSTGQLTGRLKRELAEMEAKQRAHRQSIEDMGRGFLTFGALAVAGLAVAGKAAIEWESAWTGVRKTVDGSDQEMAALEGELRKLARTLPATHQEIAGVAEAAGQLGIKRKDIAEFTKTMVDLGNTTNLTAEEAATSLAKFSNIMGTSAKDVDRLGSALVALGNDGASTEKDILAMGLRIAGAGKQIGLTEAQVLGFASALSSVGIEAEAGGSSISRVMVDIEQAVRGGGQKLELFAKTAGMSGEAFAKAYRDDAAGAIATFIGGLSRLQKSGGDVFKVLGDLGFSEILVRDALLRTAGASDLLTKSLGVGSKAWAENKALADEANKRYETSASKLKVAGNQIKDAAIDIGAAVAPMFVAAAEGVSNLVRWFQGLPGPVKDVITILGVATVAVSVFGGAMLLAVPKVIAFRETMRTLIATGGAASGVLGKFGLLLAGPVGAALGVATVAVSVFGMAAGESASEQAALADAGREIAAAMKEQGGAINANVREVAAKKAADAGLLQMAKALGIELSAVTDAILGQGDAYEKIRVKLEAMTEQSSDRSLWQGDVDNLAPQVLLDRLTAMKEQTDAANKSQADAADAAKGTTSAMKSQADATEALAKSAKEAADALDGLVKALDEINGVTLNFDEAQRRFTESIWGAQAALAENGKTLAGNTKEGIANQRALAQQAEAANALAEAAAREAEATGGATAGAAAFTASLTASRQVLIDTAKKFGLSEVAAKEYADRVLAIPPVAPTLVITPGSREAAAELARVRDAVNGVPPKKDVNVGVLSEAAIQKLRDVGYTVRTLPDGTVVVSGNTKPAQNDLSNIINRINSSSATLRVNIVGRTDRVAASYGAPGLAYGGIVAFANGGFHEDHRPQIARSMPGTVRVWAEPDTDKESYIPWAMDRRPRAVSILSQTADGFGFALVPKSQMVQHFVHGGMTGAHGGGSTGLPSDVVLHATFVDADGTFLGRMQGVAKAVVDQEGRNIYLAGGRRS